MNCRSYGDSGSKSCRLASDVIHEVAEQEGSVCVDQDVLPCLFSAGRSVAVVVGSVATTGGILTANSREEKEQCEPWIDRRAVGVDNPTLR
jgi:hypothetical protein